MRIENQLTFTEQLTNRTGFYLWMHSLKCKYIRIVFYIAMLVSTILMITGLLRTLIIKKDLTMMLLFLLVDLLLFAAIVLIWPLVFRSKAISQIKGNVKQIVTMDDKYVNVHTPVSHERYRLNHFNDFDEDERYYYLFAPDVYVIFDKKRFKNGTHQAFLENRVIARLQKNASRKTRNSRYLIIFAGDYLTPIVDFCKKTWGKISSKLSKKDKEQ